MIDSLPQEFTDFMKFYQNIEVRKIVYRTDKAGYSFLRYLAHSYYRNELIPDEWRMHINE